MHLPHSDEEIEDFYEEGVIKGKARITNEQEELAHVRYNHF